MLVHRGAPIRVPWRLTAWSFRDGLPFTSNFYCLPGTAGGSPYLFRGSLATDRLFVSVQYRISPWAAVRINGTPTADEKARQL